jgi:methanogenic corrinoid protein MtbC1
MSLWLTRWPLRQRVGSRLLQAVAVYGAAMAVFGLSSHFGLSLVAEFFYRAGWDVSTSFIQPTGSLSALVERQWFDVIGFSLGSEARLRLLDESIRQARRASMNPHVHIIAGGSVFSLQPELSERISADAVILDASQAPELATRALARLKTAH